MRAITAGLLAAACTAALTGSIPTASALARPPAANAAAEHADQAREPYWVRDLRSALSVFKDPKVAERYGYERTDVCKQFQFTAPGDEYVGAMGYHYVNKELAADPKIDPYRPEILVYVPGKNGRRVLGAVEYLRYDADGLLSTTGDRPRLFGQDFDGPFPPLEDGMPAHYSLHIWLFTHNPKGPFEPWNPAVRCPSAAAKPAKPSVKPSARPAVKPGKAREKTPAKPRLRARL